MSDATVAARGAFSSGSGEAPFDWTCRACGRLTTIPKENFCRHDDVARKRLVDETMIPVAVETVFCPSPTCGSYQIEVGAFTAEFRDSRAFRGELRHFAILHPPVSQVALAPGVPSPVAQDYREAAAVSEISPRAAATLARRCLQNLVRDFWGIAASTLDQELAAIKGKVDATLWNAIDAARKFGNWGAHPEKDPQTIFDVTPEEVGHLLRTLEFLFQRTYVDREIAKNSLAAIVAARQGKKPRGEPELGGAP